MLSCNSASRFVGLSPQNPPRPASGGRFDFSNLARRSSIVVVMVGSLWGCVDPTAYHIDPITSLRLCGSGTLEQRVAG